MIGTACGFKTAKPQNRTKPHDFAAVLKPHILRFQNRSPKNAVLKPQNLCGFCGFEAVFFGHPCITVRALAAAAVRALITRKSVIAAAVLAAAAVRQKNGREHL